MRDRQLLAREAVVWLATAVGFAVVVTYLPLPFGDRGDPPTLLRSLIWGAVFATALLVRRVTSRR